MSAELVGWLVLRAVYAWMFLYPAMALLRDWSGTVATTSLLFPWKPAWFAVASLVLMIVGSIMILVGCYGQFAAAGLFLFCLGGARVHYRLAANAMRVAVGSGVTPAPGVDDLRKLAVVGHVTSAEKNFVLAAVALFMTLVGTGPGSLIPSNPLF